jgi:hypothetical protein
MYHLRYTHTRLKMASTREPRKVELVFFRAPADDIELTRKRQKELEQ